MSLNDVMLDLETGSNKSNAAIVSIGAVLFEPLTGEMGAEFYCPVKLSSSAHYGDLDAYTMQWWMKQSKEAQAVFNDENAVSLKEALERFSNWLAEHCDLKEVCIWGNGAGFDNVILSNAYQATRQRTPWKFSHDRDVRTIVDLGKRILGIDPKSDMTLEGTAHNALDDAKHQVRYVSEILKALAVK